MIAALVMLRPLRPAVRRRAAGGVREGLRYAASRQQLWLPLVMMALVGLLAFNFPVILPVLASRTFHGNGGTYGLLSTMLSIGSVAGSLGVGFIRHPRRPYLMTAALAFGVFLAATAGAPDVAVACLTLLASRPRPGRHRARPGGNDKNTGPAGGWVAVAIARMNAAGTAERVADVLGRPQFRRALRNRCW